MTEAGAQTARPGWGLIARKIRVPLGFFFAAFYLWRARPTWLSLAAGACIVALGVAVRALASGTVKKNRELTMHGPYAYVRNPLYLGSILLAIGFGVAARDVWVAIVIMLLFLLIYLPVIRSEEAFLRSQFPQYEEYTRRVPALLPRTLLLRQIGNGFSRDLYFHHREYNAVLGAAAMLVALVLKVLWLRG